MTDEEIAKVCAYVRANWPAAKMTTDTLDVYRMELAPLDFETTICVLREDFADADFAPPPMKLRRAVTRALDPEVSWESLVSELLRKINDVGYASPEPIWSHSVLADFVEQRGGWQAICAGTPGRDALGPNGMSTFATWQAQARDHLRTLIGRYEFEMGRVTLDGVRRELPSD